MPDNVVLIMRFHPVGGEDVSVISEDFTGEDEALEAVARALDERRSLVLPHARYDRKADENGVIINLANVVSVRVSRTEIAAKRALIMPRTTCPRSLVLRHAQRLQPRRARLLLDLCRPRARPRAPGDLVRS